MGVGTVRLFQSFIVQNLIKDYFKLNTFRMTAKTGSAFPAQAREGI
jgi:hypothetical protein